jgi:hypothetical protein
MLLNDKYIQLFNRKKGDVFKISNAVCLILNASCVPMLFKLP